MTGDAAGEGALERDAQFQASGRFAAIPVTDRLSGRLRLRVRLWAGDRAPFGEVLDLVVFPE
jgi:hypothetical protein